MSALTRDHFVRAAWAARGVHAPIARIEDISMDVSTNTVHRVVLEDGHEVICKVSSYGSYVHFRQDHQRLHRFASLLQGTRYRSFLAPVLERDGEVFTYRDGDRWAVFYGKVPFYDFLPKVLSDEDVICLGRELAAFHVASTRASRRLEPMWKTLGSDIAHLYELSSSPEFRARRDLPDGAEATIKRHCDRFLTEAERLGYHSFARVPVLVDWNIGNFSVGYEAEGFKLYSRWDYDWFRIEPRTLDFYFLARVVREEGDQAIFHYDARPFFEPRFATCLRAYHSVDALEANEIRFLREAFRFFLLEYVLRMGEHFFRPDICARLTREVVHDVLPGIDELSFEPLVDAVLRAR